MAVAAIKKYGGYALGGLAAGLWLVALFLLAKTAQNSAQFGRLHPWILLINAVGVVVLLVLLAAKLTQLVRDYRRHVIGSRLKLRTVTIFGALVIPPLLIVYYFALEFLNRGIDSWFDVEVKQGLNEALMLSRAVLDLNRREYLDTTEALAQSVGRTPEDDLIQTLDFARRTNGALEITLLGQHGRIVATSTERPAETSSAAAFRRSDAAGPAGSAVRESRASAGWRLHHSYGSAAHVVYANRRTAGSARGVSGARASRSARRYGATSAHAVWRALLLCVSH